MTTKISYAIAFLGGLGLIFIGARFLLSPKVAEAGYGIRFNEGGDYSFHYIKGIRDVFSGLLLCSLVAVNERRALAITLLAAIIVPTVDMIIVLNKSYNGILQALPHIIAIIICFVPGIMLLRKKAAQVNNNTGFVQVIQSADGNRDSIIEFNILPEEKTPWHYHTLFSETFEVLKGRLEVGQNTKVLHLQKGDLVTIMPDEQHYFNNTTNNECLIKVTISPGNKNFEQALLISKGLAKDGLASKTGTPKKLSDLALFIYLNNSRIVGIQKIAEPFFNFLSKMAIKNGRLEQLILKYCKQ